MLKQFHHCREYVTGTLCLTDRHLIFIEPTGAQETWVSEWWDQVRREEGEEGEGCGVCVRVDSVGD